MQDVNNLSIFLIVYQVRVNGMQVSLVTSAKTKCGEPILLPSSTVITNTCQTSLYVLIASLIP